MLKGRLTGAIPAQAYSACNVPGMAQDALVAHACLLLVCGLPGSGKTSFCRALVAQGGLGAKWVHVCYDEVEQGLRFDQSKFDPDTWQQARMKVVSDVRQLLEASSASEHGMVIVLDDNMYYRSMRKRWYHLCRECSCAYRQLFLQASEEVCIQRNEQRDARSRVPESELHLRGFTKLGATIWVPRRL